MLCLQSEGREGEKRGRQEGRRRERTSSDGPTDFLIIQSGAPSLCGGVLRVGLASSVLEVLSQTHPESCFQVDSKSSTVDNGE